VSGLGLVYVLFIASAIWVGVDASQRDFSHDRFANATWKWVVGCLLLWIVVFPVYLARRGRAPLRRTAAASSVAPSVGILPPHMQSARGYETPPAAAPPSPSAGWYVDPHDARQLRYWDGERWSSSTAPLGDTPSQ
jgi:Protein of unknown function (DUF2510)